MQAPFFQSQNSLSLFEVHEFIRQVLALNLPEALWIRCELASVKSSKGHCYLELVQKSTDGNEIVAQGQAVLWQKEHRILQKKMGAALGTLLSPGMEVLMLAQATFHERYGLKLMVLDLDATHTLGQLELRRRDAILQLQARQLLEKNARLPLPVVLQRIAVLTSEQAAGYQDFRTHLAENTFGFRFNVTFFQAAVQGELVEKEMIRQLEAIRRQAASFDAIVILRGGGARLDLAAFDGFGLCAAVAQMPLPVLSGIGHDSDETVLDLVAHTSLKTPTAVADFILNRNFIYENEVLTLALQIKNLARQHLKNKEIPLRQMAQLVDIQSKNRLQHRAMMLAYLQQEVPLHIRRLQQNRLLQLANLEENIRLLSPQTALKRGFASVSKQGKSVNSIAAIAPGDELCIQLSDGTVITIVKHIEHEK